MFKSFFENVIKPKDSFGGRLMLKSMNKGHEKLAKWGRSYLEIKKDDIILDLGCGGGRNIEYFLTKANKVYGIDYSKTSVEMASFLNKEAIKEGRCKIIEADAKNIPFQEKSIDIISAFETIYFWDNIEECFKEIYRVLKDGGIFLICNEGAFKEEKNIKKWQELLNFTVYSPTDLEKMLTKLGFTCQYHLDRKKQLVFIGKK
ncbi:MAG: class I SAM-dependent methyltransferase [Peptoniphilaceae bacterium]|nr:class I SAM-dependent methyltransferase [Peptoniphilaceae bacterium]MDY6018572.1 class I SAM-dependent methyltransferase [Anaerococcus sp.]